MKTFGGWLLCLLGWVLPAAAEGLSAVEGVPGPAVIEAIPVVPRCEYLIAAVDDFIVEIYKNGERVPDAQRTLLVERFGATVEQVAVPVKAGDWLVFQVANNRLRWDGSQYFAVAGCLSKNRFGFVSDPASADWSVCDDPAQAGAFIKRREEGQTSRARTIEVPWGEGDDFMKEYAGSDFTGKALWGSAHVTWIKYIARGPEIEKEARPAEKTEPPVLLQPKRWPVQILSAIYGTGGKNADVTAKVKEHVEIERHRFSANPTDLGADPNPYWNKGLHIVYMKDGVRREQHRGENETLLPESFYGPQDAGELRAWLPGTRWFGEQPELQFQADQTFTSPGAVPNATNRWEATAPNKVRLTFGDSSAKEYVFDYTWSSFSELGNAKNVWHLAK